MHGNFWKLESYPAPDIIDFFYIKDGGSRRFLSFFVTKNLRTDLSFLSLSISRKEKKYFHISLGSCHLTRHPLYLKTHYLLFAPDFQLQEPFVFS